jgi:GxxExxY protein
VRIDEITGSVIGAAIKVHSALGPGVLESAYQKCLVYELRKRNFQVREHVAMPVVYDCITLDRAYEADLIINDLVIVEVKAVTRLHPVHEAQLLSYLVLSGLTVGLLINFHELHLKDGIRRMVHRFQG